VKDAVFLAHVESLQPIGPDVLTIDRKVREVTEVPERFETVGRELAGLLRVEPTIAIGIEIADRHGPEGIVEPPVHLDRPDHPVAQRDDHFGFDPDMRVRPRVAAGTGRHQRESAGQSGGADVRFRWFRHSRTAIHS